MNELEELKQKTIKRCIKDTDSPEEIARKMEMIDRLVMLGGMAKLDNLLIQMESY